MASLKLSGILFLALAIVFCSTLAVAAQCDSETAKIAALIKIGEDDGKKTPLILIHGLQGVEGRGDTAVLDDYWGAFVEKFWKTDKVLQSKYALYAFQYCSDRVDVSAIGAELGNLLDSELADREHVILAHSMGGLVATSYMSETVHASGKWKDRSGGDTTLGLITLATPHHGTPGANSPKTMEKYIPLLYRLFYPRANKLFWESTLGKAHPAVGNSALPNRSDLRWDNYDLKFARAPEDSPSDINTKLYRRNELFKKYHNKLIAYAGHLPQVFSGIDTLAALDDMIKSGSVVTKENKHRVLEMANYFFVNGLSNSFKVTDGLVPFDSGLFCVSGAAATNAGPRKNYICDLSVKVRRFEDGAKAGSVPKGEYPDKLTLSIFRSKEGFDHLDMLENINVLKFVATDLKSFVTVKAPPAAVKGKAKK
ncbi:MAG TPA: hypothetical protein VGO50_02120 [Pyrinomonadaceae bacterium]|jgi:hypothetical protein|nr:hypothetical protein [Pyrinomonadaceae bacterium]